MHFTAPREKLNTLIQTAQKAVSQRSPMPLLTCLYFETKDNLLFLSSTDLEFGIRCTMPVSTIISGATAIPAKYVANLFTRLPDVDINVKCDISSNTTTFMYGDSEVVLNGYPADEFPVFPSLPDKPTLVLKQGQFKNMIKHVIFAVSTEEHRPVFTGVNIQVSSKGVISMVATDTRRLALYEEDLDMSPDLTQIINIIVPGKTLNELFKILESIDDNLYIYVTENKVFFVIDNICIMSRLIAGQFPDYKIVIPENYICEVRTSVSNLLEAAERVSLLVNTKRNVFNINFKPDGMMIYFYTETGRIREELDANFSGDPLDVGFNVRFFIDVLKSIDNDEVIIKLSGQDSPSLLKPVGDDRYFSILVPAVSQG
ncbi:DNA polymerase III subunit beta [Desulfoscipio gibsoniae]|uniref:Beta sliding clamp n=1 Tax=Desulfoscipio gibsoniae DSM 7213 TaxID=767817 RepID=R4KD56_9FIRM|nr:DNA polymerase III subunit beta [Desulfoscipio gibsoniae]AGK99631.1 DNA polymerase III, beta subunit [Desulfoscipio gibsoniae DSM 7213]